MSIKHAYVSPVPAQPHPQVNTTDWNAAHLITIDSTSVNANGSIAAPPNTPDLVEATGGGGGITLTLPSAVANPGCVVRVKKVDSGAGAITLQDAVSATIDGGATYTLTNQWQYVVLQASVASGNWNVIGGN
jgi:hypothetical protein